MAHTIISEWIKGIKIDENNNKSGYIDDISYVRGELVSSVSC